MEVILILEEKCSSKKVKRDKGIGLRNRAFQAKEEKGSERESKRKAKLIEKREKEANAVSFIQGKRTYQGETAQLSNSDMSFQ